MKKEIINPLILFLSAFLFFASDVFSQDPNFHIYLCFGQSNMEGQGNIETQDRTGVNSRFKVFQALDCANLGRTKASWYTAVPPTCQCYSKLSPADYFGRTMVANLPDSITIGIINVAIGGCDIRLFDKDKYLDYDSTYSESWFTDKVKAYGGNPYEFLMNLAKLAQQDGVIKGILLHQGETNTGDNQWPSYVKTIYNNMMSDLSLEPSLVPILAGEVVSAAQGGCCSSMNAIINRLPAAIPNAYVISSSGCTDLPDNAHFTSDGYRKIGRRYAVRMLSLLGYEAVYAETECATLGDSCLILADKKASNESYVTGKPGYTDISPDPPSDANSVKMNFTVSKDTSYYLYGRFNNPATGKGSYWVKTDNGEYDLFDGLITTGWQWLEIKTCEFTAGEHSISIAFGESGTKLDKLVIKNSGITPVDVGEEAINLCVPNISTLGLNEYSKGGYSLEPNYPNPVTGGTSIAFEIPMPGYVSLKVFNSQGIELAELAGKNFTAGKHTLTYNLEELPASCYFYTLKSDQFSASRNMVVLSK